MNQKINETKEFENAINEIFLPIQGYEGLYSIGSCGTVLSHNYARSGLTTALSQGTLNHGHKIVRLAKDGVITQFLVHRLVAIHFLGMPDDPALEVNHVNEDPSDNRVSNLEWVSHRDNLNHGTARIRSIQGHKKPVIQSDLEGNFIRLHKSMKDLIEKEGHNYVSLRQAITDEKPYRNYRWEFALDQREKTSKIYEK